MASINLWGIVLPKPTNILGKPVHTLRVESRDRPKCNRLEFDESRGMVVVELEAKAEMPNLVLIPKEQVSAMVPMPKKADLKYELFADDDVPTVEQLEAQRAKAREEAAERATKAKLPDETVSSSKSEVVVTCSPGNPCEDGCARCAPRAAGVGKYEVNIETGGVKEIKPQPKKRGPKKGWKSKKK